MYAARPLSDDATKEPFPRTFYVANIIELFERMAFYGMYIGLSLYLSSVVGFGDAASGTVLGTFRLVSSLAPIPAGAIADRIRFRRSLLLAFSLYAVGYGALFATRYVTTPGSGAAQALAVGALLLIGVGGGFMKPVITGTVVRTSPEGRQTEGFGIFYRMVNAGSVVGKIAAYAVRALAGLGFVMINSLVGSLASLGLTALAYREPDRSAPGHQPLSELIRGYARALSVVRFTAFLVIFAGFYFMAEQFYFTFPKYIVRTVNKDAPLELIGLVNPALIAIFQGVLGGLTARLRPVTTMILGMSLAAVSMFAMGAVPGMVGALLSAAIFACAEMTFSPRFYDYIASFAPKGKAGMFMGLAFVPAAIGAWLGGSASGFMVATYLPEKGAKEPHVVWWSYAAIGAGCVLLMIAYRAAVDWADRRAASRAAAAPDDAPRAA